MLKGLPKVSLISQTHTKKYCLQLSFNRSHLLHCSLLHCHFSVPVLLIEMFWYLLTSSSTSLDLSSTTTLVLVVLFWAVCCKGSIWVSDSLAPSQSVSDLTTYRYKISFVIRTFTDNLFYCQLENICLLYHFCSKVSLKSLGGCLTH